MIQYHLVQQGPVGQLGLVDLEDLLDLEYLERLYSLLGLVDQSNLFDPVCQVRLEVPDRL